MRHGLFSYFAVGYTTTLSTMNAATPNRVLLNTECSLSLPWSQAPITQGGPRGQGGNTRGGCPFLQELGRSIQTCERVEDDDPHPGRPVTITTQIHEMILTDR